MNLDLFILSIIAELTLVSLPFIWAYKNYGAAVVSALIGLWTGHFVINQWSGLAVVVLIVSLYRIFNMFRLGKNRFVGDHLKRTVRRSSVFLLLAHVSLYGYFVLDPSPNSNSTRLALAAFQFIAALSILGIISKNLFKTKHHSSRHFYSDKELPTVTVAIPARNETADLASCLQSILSSDYPKLEILVLDDCSLDRTPEIIRDFAQDGVRFIEGKPPKSRWLAKNQAYQQLTEAASGELVLFCGVDMRFGAEAIRSLVTTLLNKKRDMICVMPFRIGGGVRTAFIQPMRYWWELALPRRFFNRPPVLDSCWLINRASLKKLGSFKAVSQTIIPETYFARELIKTDGYAFIRADEHLDVRTVKGVEAQLSTALRTRYPQLRKRPENVFLLSFVELAVLLMPFVVVAQALLQGFDPAAYLSLLTIGLYIAAHYMILSASNPSNSLIALFNFPFVVITEIVLLHISMYRYEFSVVEWKGRNICIPVMHAIPRLPAIK